MQTMLCQISTALGKNIAEHEQQGKQERGDCCKALVMLKL